ncbi:hypothetical protein scyTo_0023317, partial [Scyliorhinus torazame]|nr:hypothetical protein [Scyliorhinus torazame]
IEEKELSRNYVVLLEVTVRGSGGNISINETKRVVLKRYDSLTFIQTDKAVYKPGQTVKFRIVTLNEDFIPIQEKVRDIHLSITASIPVPTRHSIH